MVDHMLIYGFSNLAEYDQNFSYNLMFVSRQELFPANGGLDSHSSARSLSARLIVWPIAHPSDIS